MVGFGTRPCGGCAADQVAAPVDAKAGGECLMSDYEARFVSPLDGHQRAKLTSLSSVRYGCCCARYRGS